MSEQQPNDAIETLDLTAWSGPLSSNMSAAAVAGLEGGAVLFFPRLAFDLSGAEKALLDPAILAPGAKNVAFDPKTGALKHAADGANSEALRAMMARYAEQARALVAALAPPYADALTYGRTSFRPMEIRGRAASARKDDTRLHVDAFPTSPMGDKRILRLFTNVNPNGRPRMWRLGERFEDVARAFAPRAGAQTPGAAWLQRQLGLTKGLRTPYDHFMLAIHDGMKLDDAYRAATPGVPFDFPPGSSWLVFTDQVSHAAMGGQHLLEQTFYLPVSAMVRPETSPLHTLERLTGRSLARA